ncbi:hypothetical protein RR48_08553 [Papilio machaon]|uniref:Uncharacterized protein n=1 Tax=Papilio machaon TaxID=76193 RepID=A0A194RIH9_PAPMA|nr:hypothetical protein RR48_08553 [Papilio machaon]
MSDDNLKNNKLKVRRGSILHPPKRKSRYNDEASFITVTMLDYKEISDTESAVGGRERSRLSALGARMRAALPRARDRVQATEPTTDTDDKILSEEKKGVVYAELQLGEQTAEKPPPPSTEYAEIVYTDKNQQETKE